MKKPKLIALDMDGTLLDGESRMTGRTKLAVRAAQNAGIKIVVATGRMYPSAMIHIRDAGIESLSVFYNGAVVRDTATGEIAYERSVGRELTAEIMSFFREHGWYIQLYSDDRLVVHDRSDERCRYYESLCGLKAVELGENFWNCGLDSSKLLGISFDKDEFAGMCAEVSAAFGPRIWHATSWNAFIEIAHPDVNKAEGLRRVCELYGIDREDVIAIGDGSNDIEMIRWAGTGVAMGNAKPAVKEAADAVAPRNDEDGAAQIIEAAVAAEEP